VNTVLTVSAGLSASPGNYTVVVTVSNGTTSRSSTTLIVHLLPASAGPCLLCWFFPIGWFVFWPYLLTWLLWSTLFLNIKISKNRPQ
jgi:hypothetical protein